MQRNTVDLFQVHAAKSSWIHHYPVTNVLLRCFSLPVVPKERSQYCLWNGCETDIWFFFSLRICYKPWKQRKEEEKKKGSHFSHVKQRRRKRGERNRRKELKEKRRKLEEKKGRKKGGKISALWAVYLEYTQNLIWRKIFFFTFCTLNDKCLHLIKLWSLSLLCCISLIIVWDFPSQRCAI